ncbi:hypothetical protein [Owenweeksia hongkongensis]|uniref:hypothetical protein n=1 Tax=Owenweeksia hongkongensis TaxID=253245 RepID=UPI003A8E9151
MHRNFHIDIQNEAKFLNDIKSDKPFIEIGSENIWELGFETEPHADYEKPKDFPKCCVYHTSIKEQLDEWFIEFPDCCENHKELKTRTWFDKIKYNEVPNKILNVLSFTENFISKNIEKNNWFEEVTDYINYSIESFGTPDIGGNKYFVYLRNWIETTNPNDFDFPKWKRNQLLEFLENLSNPPAKPKTDLNILFSTFQKWTKTFPNLPYFNNLKKELKNKIPLNIMLYEPKSNKFTGITKFKMRTKGELVEILIKFTKNLLTSINTPLLLENKLIDDKQKYEIDLLNEEHNIKQNQLLVEYSKKEIKYVNIIKKWLKNEKEYVAKLQPLIKNLKTMPKLFTVEKRETFGKEYLKVYLRDKSRIEEVAGFITSLQSVRTCNVTENKEIDLTVYPAKTYSADEMNSEIEVALNSYFNKGQYDPVFEDKISSLSDEGYDNILTQIYNYGQNLEKYKNLYDKFDEEGFRDFFLPHLNSISKSHTATGETFNKIGKTDILIQDENGINVFIAECKLWKGESELSKAIDQLLDRYVTWRDEKVALIVFNKDMKNFTELMAKAVEKLKQHPLFDKYLGKRNDSSYQFTFKHPDDPDKIIKLELIIFNCV